MKAVVIHRYGAPEELVMTDLPTPQPGPGQVLIGVRATSVNVWDWRVRNGSMKLLTGSRFPKILGGECAGVVQEVGAHVTDFKPGDAVIGMTGPMGGSYAEYVVLPTKKVARMPTGLSFADATTLPVAASTAYNGLLGQGKLKARDRVLVNGASGAVGTFAVQIAKAIGAHVTAVCSAANHDLVRSLGADHVLDYKTTNVYDHGGTYPLVFDAVSTLQFRKVKPLLASGGTMVNTLPMPAAMLLQLWTSFQNKRFKTFSNNPTAANIELLAQWVAEGKIRVVTDRVFTFDQLPQAHAYSETGRARGKIVITVA